MLRLFIVCVAAVPLCLAAAGCGGDPKPKADPQFKVATNPSDAAMPGGFKKNPRQPAKNRK